MIRILSHENKKNPSQIPERGFCGAEGTAKGENLGNPLLAKILVPF